MIIGTFLVVGIASGYTQSARRAEWSAYSLAAQSLAMQQMELVRASKYDPLAYNNPTNTSNPSDQLVQGNFPTILPGNANAILDIPISGTNITYARVTTTITPNVGGNPLLRMVRVETVWPYLQNGNPIWQFGNRQFTNTVVTYRGPDQ